MTILSCNFHIMTVFDFVRILSERKPQLYLVKGLPMIALIDTNLGPGFGERKVSSNL